MLNNAIDAIIVYGSQAPGEKNHAPFSTLPGTWLPGKIKVDPIDLPDEIGPGEVQEVPAWYLEFSDIKKASYGTPKYHKQAVMLHDRWIDLDQALSPAFVRGSTRWWPDGVECVINADMRATNIYLPRAHWPYLADQTQPPHPDREDDIAGLWRDVVAHDINYDTSMFIALIKDARPADYDALFGSLPNGAAFVQRLRAVFDDLALSPDSMLWDGVSDGFHLYAHPPVRHAVSQDALLTLAKDAIAARLPLLSGAQADALRRLTFQPGSQDDAAEAADTGAYDAWEDANDMNLDSRYGTGAWGRCLAEACYGIAASYQVADYLMGAFGGAAFDPAAEYRFWLAGGRYEIGGDTCFVWAEPLREA